MKFGKLLLLFVASFMLCGCGSTEPSESIDEGGIYTVKFDTHGGTAVEEMTNVSVIETSPVTTRVGYIFKGWYDSLAFANLVSFPYTPSHDITLHADWKDDPTTFTVSFETNGGNSIVPLYGVTTVRELPTPTKNGFEFAGWYLDSNYENLANLPYIVKVDTVLYAKWINKGMADEILVGQAKANDTATAFWDCKYQEDHLAIKVRVEDKTIFNAYSNTDGTFNGMNDNVEIYLSNKRNKTVGLFENDTTKIMAIPGLGIEVRKFRLSRDNYTGSFEFNQPLDCEITGSAEISTQEKDGYDGYFVDIKVPYTYFKMSHDEALGNISLFFAMRNTDSDFATTYHESTFLAAERRNVWTYPLLGKDNKFTNYEVDTILVGDSYLDSQFYLPLNDAFKGTNVYARAIGGTKSYEWSTLFYNNIISSKPKTIVMHIGVNDINAGDLTGENTLTSIKSLLNKIRGDLPNTKIYWITIQDNHILQNYVEGVNKYANAYQNVNNGMKAFKNGFTDLEIIDFASATNGNVSYFLEDGLHPNNMGYNILTKLIREALGIEVNNGTTFGNVGELVSSAGFDFSKEANGTISTTGNYNQYAWVKASESTNFSFEAALTADEITHDDQFPKMGIVIKAREKMLFFYVDMFNEFQGTKVGFTYAGHRNDINGFGFDWSVAQESEELDIKYVGSNAINLKVVYTNGQVSLFCDDEEIFTIMDCGFGTAPVNVGLLSFNTAFHTTSFEYLEG